MFVQKLDHVNIRVKDPDATVAFLQDVLMMGRHELMANWLCDQAGNPVIHVGNVEGPYPSDALFPFDGDKDGGPVHHVALQCAGYDDVCARLEERGLPYATNYVPQVELRQLFVSEPGGVLLELNFFGNVEGETPITASASS